MNKFALKTKNGERIAAIVAENIDDAIELFADKKQLKKTDLLEIFIVEKEELI